MFPNETYASLINHMNMPELTSGDKTIGDSTRNIILWTGVSREFAETFNSLVRDERIVVLTSTHILSYLIDGAVLPYPIAKRYRVYNNTHWMPASINLKPEFRAKLRG